MKGILLIGSMVSSLSFVSALTISEVMSNPTGDDGGREWVELYNDSDESIDLSSLTLSIKGGTPLTVGQVSGGVTLLAKGYAIVGSTVASLTKFTQDYPLYKGVLLKSGISLVNTGVTSLDIFISGNKVDTLSSYTGAKEGFSLSKIGTSFSVTEPTPGAENKQGGADLQSATTTETASQKTLPQMSPPSADIVLYLPREKTVVAGAPSVFMVASLTHDQKPIQNMSYTWSFGDGGSRTGSTTLYRYFYPGRYVAQVEGTNGLIAGVGRMIVSVVSPELTISPVSFGKYGAYLDITNPNSYDIDISDWKLTFDNVPFSFPKNTLLSPGVTRFSGVSMGFSTAPITSTTTIKLLFPSLDEVLRITQGERVPDSDTSSVLSRLPAKTMVKDVVQSKSIPKALSSLKISNNSTQVGKNFDTGTSSSQKSIIISRQKDVKIASWIKSLFLK